MLIKLIVGPFIEAIKQLVNVHIIASEIFVKHKTHTVFATVDNATIADGQKRLKAATEQGIILSKEPPSPPLPPLPAGPRSPGPWRDGAIRRWELWDAGRMDGLLRGR